MQKGRRSQATSIMVTGKATACDRTQAVHPEMAHVCMLAFDQPRPMLEPIKLQRDL